MTFTSLSMSHQQDPEEPPVVLIRQVKQRDIDYEDLTLVDHLARRAARRGRACRGPPGLARIVSSATCCPGGRPPWAGA